MKIFVGNLHLNASELMLRDLFGKYGQVTSVTIVLDQAGKPEGFAYVEMREHAQGREAIGLLNNINFMNRFLVIHELT